MIALIIALVLSPFTVIGAVTVVAWWNFKRQPGVDSSNWFNPIRLWWFLLTRPDLFVGTFPWLALDEFDVVANKGAQNNGNKKEKAGP